MHLKLTGKKANPFDYSSLVYFNYGFSCKSFRRFLCLVFFFLLCKHSIVIMKPMNFVTGISCK